MIKKGTTRWVWLCGNYAIKTPSLYSWKAFLQGLLANMQERYWWNSLKHPRLAKVYYCDPLGFCLIMERAEYTLEEQTCVNTRALDYFMGFCNVCEEEGLPVDPTPSNVGVFNGTYKLIDYGS